MGDPQVLSDSEFQNNPAKLGAELFRPLRAWKVGSHISSGS